MKIVGIAFGVAVIGIIIALSTRLSSLTEMGTYGKVNDIKRKPYEK